ncbi:MAG: L-histidine N(alpha)-methyltransferase [Ponticaulis sp.]|nr:L-histidine N(alpha)-methyltransferase [Ponticaulis sp.]
MADTAQLSSKLAYLIDAEAPVSDFRTDVIEGLSAPPFELPPKYFYDANGAELFEAICTTPEYYVTRAEIELLQTSAASIADIIGPDANIIEPGSGAAEKVRILLKALPNPAEYTLFDISREQLDVVARGLAEDFPRLRVGAVAGDFTRPLLVTGEMFQGSGKRMCFFPGGTIGNFSPTDQITLLSGFKSWLRPGDGILIGVDRIKNAARLDAAYNDAAGYTARFNLNLLRHMQSALGAELNTDDWDHQAFFNIARGCIEMHLRANRDTQIGLDQHVFQFSAGETILTEESWKFDEARLRALADALNLDLKHIWSSKDDAFSHVWLEMPDA